MSEETIKELKDTRNTNRKINTQTLKESEQAVNALKEAISIMQEFYASHRSMNIFLSIWSETMLIDVACHVHDFVKNNNSGTVEEHHGSESETGVMDLLIQLQSDYNEHMVNTKQEEQQQITETKKEVGDHTTNKKG